MKNITVHFEDEEFKRLKKLKDSADLSWHDFILELLNYRKDFGVWTEEDEEIVRKARENCKEVEEE